MFIFMFSTYIEQRDGFEAYNDQEMVDNAMLEVTKEIAYPGSSTIPAGNVSSY